MAKKLFVNAKTEAGLNAAVAEGTLNAEVAFLEEQGNEGIHAKGKTYQTIPSNGRDGQVLMASNGKGVWTDLDVLDMLSYGVKWKPNVADPVLTRVGNINLHRALPIQSGMKGCIYNTKQKKVVYWLDESDWRFAKEDSKSGFQTFIDENVASFAFYLDQEGDFAGYKTELNTDDYPILRSALHYEPHVMHARLRDSQVRDIICTVQMVDASDLSGNALRINPLNEEDRERLDSWLSSWIEAHENTYPDITQWEFGSDCTGFDGEVMVYIPSFYIKSWDEPDRREVRISTVKIDDTWEYQPPIYLGAYRDTLIQSDTGIRETYGYVGSLPADSAVSVASYWEFCRGGGNRPSNDAYWNDIFKRDLGKCRTNIPRTTFRTYARNAGKEIMSYRQYKNIMYWLYVIEYANFNSQAPYNAELTVEGFHQGGLGNGLTNISNWDGYNGYYPISPNGYTNEFGNGTGIKLIEPGGPAPVGSVYATRWRGLENPFGDIWHNVDGIIIDADADNHPNNMNYVYTTDDPTKYGDAVSDIANMVLSGLEVHTDGYTNEWDLGTTAEVIPRLRGGNTTQYKCDYHWTGSKNTTLRTLLLGGCANTGGGAAGLGSFYSGNGVGYSGAVVGFRTSCAVDA